MANFSNNELILSGNPAQIKEVRAILRLNEGKLFVNGSIHILADLGDYLNYAFTTKWVPPVELIGELMDEFPDLSISCFHREVGMEEAGYIKRHNISRYYPSGERAEAEQTIVPELIAALKVSLNEGGITGDTMVYSENDHGERVYLKELFEGLLKRAEADSK